MAQKVDKILLTEWRQRLKRQSESGLTIEAFCQKEGVSQTMFYTWKRNLRGSSATRTASRAAGTSRRPAKPRTVGPRRPRTMPASNLATTHSRDFLQLPVRGVRSSPWIELTLVDGTVVRIPQENLAALTTLLRVLRAENGDGLGGEARHA